MIFVYNIVSRLFSPWFTDVHCKNINVEHSDPVLDMPSCNADPFPGLSNSTGLSK